MKRKNSNDGSLPMAARGYQRGTGSGITMRTVVLTAALFLGVFTVVSVSRLNRGGAMPDTRLAGGGDRPEDVAAAAAAATGAAAERQAVADDIVPDPVETAETLRDGHTHTPHAHHVADHGEATAAPRGLYALTATDVHGNIVPLAKYRGKALLVVNTASKCGYTETNYEALVKIRNKYGPHGLEVLSFPSNSFKQEPLEGARLESWAHETYGADFPVFAKAPVTGADAQPVYQYIEEHAPRMPGLPAITWNFNKFLVDPHTGQIVRTYGPVMRQHAIESDIFELLTKGRLPPPPPLPTLGRRP